MTDATLPPPHEPQDGVGLPVVAWGAKITKAREVCDPNFVAYESEEETRDMILAWNSIYECFPLTPQTPAQATIDALRDELARMTERSEALHNTLHSERDRTDKHVTNLHAEIAALKADTERLTRERDQWRNEYRFMQSQEAEMARELESLKAKQIDIDAVMRLVEVYAKAASELDDSIRSRSRAPRLVNRHDLRVHVAFKAAREALRAALLGDGGTL